MKLALGVIACVCSREGTCEDKSYLGKCTEIFNPPLRALAAQITASSPGFGTLS